MFEGYLGQDYSIGQRRHFLEFLEDVATIYPMVHSKTASRFYI